MEKSVFKQKLSALNENYVSLVQRKNEAVPTETGIFIRHKYPVITADHVPPFWKFDFNYETNPNLLQRLGINCSFNAGAILFEGKIILMTRTEGYDRKSFFAVAESENGIDHFKFRDYPVIMPELDDKETNVYDMRLTQHEDGWIYGVFCVEFKDPDALAGNLSAAVAKAGIARTKDLVNWERLPNLKTVSPQQRNVVLHPEFVDGQYAFYTRPMDAFISTGSGGGIGWALCDDITNAQVGEEKIIDARLYHTIKEEKNGQGPAPIKTSEGWLHLAHGVRNTASGLRYVLYMFMTDLKDPSKVLYKPGGYFMAPHNDEWIGDVYNVLFTNGWVKKDNGDVYMYYGAADIRVHVAKSHVDLLVDYVKNTPSDPLRTAKCVEQRIDLIRKNLKLMGK